MQRGTAELTCAHHATGWQLLARRPFCGKADALHYFHRMRLSLLFALLAAPAAAWDFTPGLPCVLTHKTADAEIELTYDPTQPLYSVTVRPNAPFSGGAVFSMRFDGPTGMTISTDRHAISPDGSAVTVVDTGFGNVLNGLQFNTTATALLGDRTISFPLAGAAVPVAKFRVCKAEPGV